MRTRAWTPRACEQNPGEYEFEVQVPSAGRSWLFWIAFISIYTCSAHELCLSVETPLRHFEWYIARMQKRTIDKTSFTRRLLGDQDSQEPGLVREQAGKAEGRNSP